MKLINVFCFFVLFMFSSVVRADVLDVALNKKVITEGETVYLTIEYQGSKNEDPNLSELQNDFQIVSNSKSSQMSYVNGVVSSSKKWTIGLVPLRKGKISIKPIKIGDTMSNYEEVEVKELSNVAYVPDSKTNFNAPYFKLEQNFDKNNVYLHEQIILNVTLYDSLGLRDGVINLSEESKNDWIVVPLSSKPIRKEDVVNGKKMHLSTLVYAIFPQKSGKLKTPEFTFDGYYIKHTSSPFSSFDDDIMIFGIDFRSSFGEKVPVKMKTKQNIIDVKPNVDGVLLKKWMPLVDLSAKANLSKEDKFKVGDAFNYKVDIRAVGISKDLFPNIEFPNSKGLKMYPEKPEFKEELDGENVVTTASYNIVYIPEKDGKITISPIDIEWFNLNTQKQEVYKINGIDIFVEANGLVKNYDLDDDFGYKKENNRKDDIVLSEGKKDNINLNKYLDKVMFIGIGILMLFVLFFALRKGNKKEVSNYNQKVINAIQKYDYSLAKNYLLEWAKHKYNDDNIKNFMMIAKYTNNLEFEKQLDILNKLLYSNSEEGFNSQEFIKLFKEVDKTKSIKNKKQEILPNLYK